MTLSVLAVQKALRDIKTTHGIDIVSKPGMVQVAGKHYGHIAPFLEMPTGDWSPKLDVYIPHENRHVSYLHTTHAGIMQNQMVPERYYLNPHREGPPRKFVHSLGYLHDENRIGPYVYDKSGTLMSAHRGAEEPVPKEFHNIHTLLSHIDKLPKAQGVATDYYSRELNGPLKDNELEGYNLRDALEHIRRWDVGIDMPKGTEHMLAILDSYDKPQEDRRYLYNLKTEELLKAPITKASID